MEFIFFPCRKTQDSSSHEAFGLLQLCPASLVSGGTLSMSTCQAPQCARGASLGSLSPPSHTPGMSPAPGQVNWEWAQAWTLPAMRPLPLWGLFSCCASCAMRTSVLLSPLKVCSCHTLWLLSLIVSPREVWLHHLSLCPSQSCGCCYIPPLSIPPPQQPLQDSL